MAISFTNNPSIIYLASDVVISAKIPKIMDTMEDYAKLYIADYKNVTEIPEDNLPDAIITSSVTNWKNAFAYMNNIEKFPVYDMSNAQDLERAYEHCGKLGTIPVLPDTVIKMDNTFTFCSNLTRVSKLPDNLQYMNGTFSYCGNLIQLPKSIPDSIIHMNGTFKNCTRLETVSFYINGNIIDLNDVFENCTNLISGPKNIPPTCVNLINTFRRCYKLRNTPVFSGNNIKNMSSAFYYCSNLTLMPQIPSSVEDLTSTFYGCSNLKTIPDFVEDSQLITMANTFSYCNNITSVPNSFPNTIINMHGTFAFCKNISNVYMIPYSVVDISGIFEHCENFTGLTTYSLSKVENMNYAFSGCYNLTRYYSFPQNVKTIVGSYSHCYNIQTTEVIIPENITDIRNVFSECKNLTNTIFVLKTKNVTTASNFLTLETPLDYVTGENRNIFNGRTIYVPENSVTYNTILNSTSWNTVENIPNPVSDEWSAQIFTFNPEPINMINFGMTHYSNYTEVNNISVPYTNNMMNTHLCTNWYGAFQGMSNLRTIPNYDFSNAQDGSFMFAGCNKIYNLPYNFKNAPFINASSMFQGANLSSNSFGINIPNTVTNMHNCFRDCRNVGDASNSVEDLSYAYYNSTGGPFTGINVSNTVTNMDYAFAYSTNLSINIADCNIDSMTYTFMDAKNCGVSISKNCSIINMAYSFINSSCILSDIPDSVINLSHAFENAHPRSFSTNTVNVGNNVVDMSYAFYNAQIAHCIIGENVVNMSHALEQAYYQPTLASSVTFLGNKVTDLSYAFARRHFVTSLINTPLSITNMKGAFSYCSQDYTDISCIIPNNVLDVSEIFINIRGSLGHKVYFVLGSNVVNAYAAFKNGKYLSGNICVYSKNITNATEFAANRTLWGPPYDTLNIYVLGGTTTNTTFQKAITSDWNASIKVVSSISQMPTE